MKKESFFDNKNCDRCKASLINKGRMMSWFNTDTLCMECVAKEDVIKKKLREQGKDPSKYEGCGYIPEV